MDAVVLHVAVVDAYRGHRDGHCDGAAWSRSWEGGSGDTACPGLRQGSGGRAAGGWRTSGGMQHTQGQGLRRNDGPAVVLPVGVRCVVWEAVLEDVTIAVSVDATVAVWYTVCVTLAVSVGRPVEDVVDDGVRVETGVRVCDRLRLRVGKRVQETLIIRVAVGKAVVDWLAVGLRLAVGLIVVLEDPDPVEVVVPEGVPVRLAVAVGRREPEAVPEGVWVGSAVTLGVTVTVR